MPQNKIIANKVNANKVIKVVREVFAGRYITSNMAEYVFQFKPLLKMRHGLKSVEYCLCQCLVKFWGPLGMI